MGDVVKFLFMPVGLGGMGVDFTKKDKPKQQAAPVYDAEAEKKKAEDAASEEERKKDLNKLKQLTRQL